MGRGFVALAFSGLAVAACSSGGGGGGAPPLPISPPPTHGPPQTGPEGKYIKHIVVIVQENRTLNDIFAGFKGADTRTYGFTHTGARVRLKAITFKGPDILHNWPNAMADWNGGRMNGFDRSLYTDNRPAGTYTYAYLRRDKVAPYWTMAREYALADHMFPTMFGPSFTAHIDLIASTTNLTPDEAEVDGPTGAPWGCDAPPGTTTLLLEPAAPWRATADRSRASRSYDTMADTLDAAHVSWKYYAPMVKDDGWAASGRRSGDPERALRAGLAAQHHLAADQSPHRLADGKLAGLSWVIPDAADSDHAGIRRATRARRGSRPS